MVDFFKTYFSEEDDSISSSLERDPLGFQPIWTSLGYKIFAGVTTSVATDIRNYTINLIHHLVVSKLRDTNFFSAFKGRSKISDVEAQQRLILALEMMLAYSALQWSSGDASGILGISSARKRWQDRSDNNIINLTKPPTDPKKDEFEGFTTLLVRQSGLGINGRYKGPFKNMGILDEAGTYDKNSQSDISEKRTEYKDLVETLVKKLMALQNKNFKLRLDENNEFIEFYEKAFSSKTVYQEAKSFWLEKMNIEEGKLSGDLYKDIVVNDKNIAEQAKKLFTNKQDPVAKQICQVEPFLVAMELLFATLIQKPNDCQLIDELMKLCNQFAEAIKNSEDVHSRLEELRGLALKQPIKDKLIKYHEKISNERGIHPWITGDKIYKKSQYMSDLDNKVSQAIKGEIQWRRDYYLASIRQIKSGFEEKAG